jgi:hypothetical protein
MKFAAYFVVLQMFACVSSFAQTPNMDSRAASALKLERMPEPLEVRFALSAAPPHQRNNATTYVLDPAKGYVLSHQGTNGVTCIVVRSDWQFADRGFRDDVYWPVCYDAEGSKTLLQDYVYAAELRAQGMDAAEVYRQVTKRFGSPSSPNPNRVGISYMIAPLMRGFTAAAQPVTMNMPHYMFYAPNLKDKDIGGNGFSQQYPFALSMNPGRDDYIILLVGETEKAKILRDSKDLLDELCSYRKYMCTTAATRARTPIMK